MIRKIVIAALVLACATNASAQTAMVSVAGWVDRPSNVEVFTIDGVPKGVRNFEGMSVAGVHTWHRGYNLVEVEKDVWVDRERLITKLCGNAPPPNSTMPNQAGGQAPRALAGMGSGTGCPPAAGGGR